MSKDEESSESSRRKLKDILEQKGGGKDAVDAAYELADEDPRSTMDLIETPIDSLVDVEEERARELLNKIAKSDPSRKSKGE